MITVALQEQGCTFEFEYKDVYWNSRLQMEHGRLIQALFLDPVIEPKIRPIIADATCGVGPFSIPLIKHGVGILSHANDLNPCSVKWLCRNAALNQLNSVECDELPLFCEDFRPLHEGSKLVIHTPSDARDFIRKLQNQRHPVTHSIFNLPATGVELLDCYRGLDFESVGLPRPLVCCYTFSDGVVDSAGNDGCVHDLLERLSNVLGISRVKLQYVREPDVSGLQNLLPLASPQITEMVRSASASTCDAAVAIRLVRNVAPMKHMFCVCFQVPRACAGGEPVTKRMKTDFLNDSCD